MRGIQIGEKSDFEAQGATKQHAVHAVHAGCLLHLAPRCKRGKSGALPVPPREKLALLPLSVCDFDRSELREIFFGAHGSARDHVHGCKSPKMNKQNFIFGPVRSKSGLMNEHIVKHIGRTPYPNISIFHFWCPVPV